jgi:hypothetical protein
MQGNGWYECLAILPYVALATWALLVAGAFLTAFSLGSRQRHFIWGAALFVMLAVYFFGLAVTGGSSPLIPRRQMAVPIRVVAVGILVLGYGWILLWARANITVARKYKGEVTDGHG